jgi:hypothetical protein
VDSEQIAYTDLSGLPVIPTLPVTSEVEVFLNGTQNLPNSTWTGIVFNQSVVVTGSALSVAPSNNGILVNTAGRYLIHAATMFSPNASGRRGITVNPSSPAAFAPQIINGASPTSTTYMVFSTILTCTAGLQLTVFMFQDSGVVLTAGNVRLNMYLLY